MATHVVFIIFLFLLGSCIGSFLNVLIHRLPREISLWWPPSACPKCETRLAWYDNIPVLGWILLCGKCRYCKKPISIRYPIIEAITGLIFVFYYVMFFMLHIGPCRDQAFLGRSLFLMNAAMLPPANYWPIYFLDMLLLCGLLAASVIDAELYIIPASIPWWIAAIAIVAHAAFDQAGMPGAQLVSPFSMSLAAGASIGLAISILLLNLGILPLSFPEGILLDHERKDLHTEARNARDRGEKEPEIPPELSAAQVRAEMRKEMLFLFAPLILGTISVAMYLYVPAVGRFWRHTGSIVWLNALLGSSLGAMIGAFVVWMTRILGSYAFGREAMGLGDVHLMFGVGAVLGGGAATVAFFLAPFFGIAVALYKIVTRSGRQIFFGPYLSLATAFIMLFYCPIARYLQPGLFEILKLLRQSIGGA